MANIFVVLRSPIYAAQFPTMQLSALSTNAAFSELHTALRKTWAKLFCQEQDLKQQTLLILFIL